MNLTIASLGTVTRDHSADPAINAAIAANLMDLTNLASVRFSWISPLDTQASHAASSSGVDGGGSHVSGGLIDTTEVAIAALFLPNPSLQRAVL